MSSHCIFFIKLPPLRQFCHVVLKINNKSSNCPQTQTLKCRQLCFLCREVVVSPNFYDDTLIDVVMSMGYFKEKKLHPICQKLGLQPIHASPAMLNVLQECFTFTMRFKISASWNMIGNFLVKGPDVVTCKDKQEAVDLDILISDEQITLTVRPQAIRNPPPVIQSFDICFQALRNFEEDENMAIEEFSIYRSWCHILPTMKRGQLVRVSHKIPVGRHLDSSSSFTDYAGLKKYWKNHHGIRLPEEETGMLYGSIYFKLIGQQLFTYPLCCLRTREIQVMPRCDGLAIIKIKPGKLLNVTMNDNAATKKMPPVPARPQISNTKNLIQTNKGDNIIPSSQQNTEKRIIDKTKGKNDHTATQVIPSSQAEKTNLGKRRDSLSSRVKIQMPTNVNGKFIPVFKAKVKSTNNCGGKIKIDVTKKKKPGSKKHSSISTSTPKQGIIGDKTNTGIVTSLAAGKTYKTPKALDHNFDDSGYDSNVTPQNMETQQRIAARKYQPKKLSFEHILNLTSDSSASPAFMKQKKSPLKIIKNHLFDSMFSKATESSQNTYSVANKTPGRATNNENKINNLGSNSPLKIMQNHSFDKLFAKAGYSTSAQKNSNIGCVSPMLHNDSGFDSSPHNILKNHSFDKLFKPANNFVNDVIPCSSDKTGNIKLLSSHTDRNSQDSNLNFFERQAEERKHISAKNHSFDKLFASASTMQSSYPRNERQHSFEHTKRSSSANLPTKKHSFAEIFKPANESICRIRNSINTSDPNVVLLSQTASVGDPVAGNLQDGSQMAGNTTEASKRKLSMNADGVSQQIVKRPKVRSNVDVEDMARENKLSKVNAATLACWLKSKGISVKSRERKEDLITKVKLQVMLKQGSFQGIDD
ncbi:uncharacterized protein LOC144424488 isoform X2 [Styela clava]